METSVRLCIWRLIMNSGCIKVFSGSGRELFNAELVQDEAGELRSRGKWPVKRGKHEAGPGVRRKKEPWEKLLSWCFWLGMAAGTVFGLVYFRRNPQEVPENVRYAGKVLTVYGILGGGAGAFLFLAVDRIKDWLRAWRR